MLKRFSIFLALMFCSMAIMAANQVVKVPVANMYAQPKANAAVISQALYGAKVDLLTTARQGWVRVKTRDNYQGWVQSKNLITSKFPSAKKSLEINVLFAHLYHQPDITKEKPVITLPFSVKLPIIKVLDQKWIQVGLVNGESAWIQQGDVRVNPQPLSVAELVSLSRMFIGLPYTWGGVSSYGVDCSGFIQMLYKQAGVLLPRDTGIQAAWSGFKPVAKDALQPGDVIFFGFNKKISHVGLYLGHGQFINATTYKKPIVQISNLNDKHWQRMYMTSRRLKGQMASSDGFVGKVDKIPLNVARLMQKYTWHKGCPVGINDLSYVTLSYWGFDHETHTGEMIVNKYLASEVVKIFHELYLKKFPIEKMRPMYLYKGDDDAAMADNDSSSFNCRTMTDYPDKYSIHSFGGAIDINTKINPYENKGQVLPPAGSKYLDRAHYQPGMIQDNGVVVKAFAKYGWVWGGSWPKFKDYQHFEKPLPRK